jgi:hypothetical protein
MVVREETEEASIRVELRGYTNLIAQIETGDKISFEAIS